jgi:hypothetical protein
MLIACNPLFEPTGSFLAISLHVGPSNALKANEFLFAKAAILKTWNQSTGFFQQCSLVASMHFLAFTVLRYPNTTCVGCVE